MTRSETAFATHPSTTPGGEAAGEALFPSFFLGGFECSTHQLRSGRRLDLVASTRHDVHAAADYRRLRGIGMLGARDGIRWHVVEPEPGRWDFTSARVMVRAALEEDVRVAWDILHFGWPDHVDVFHDDFPRRFAELAHRFAEVMCEEGETRPMVAPVNEASFLSFAGGEAGFFNPFAHGRGDALKAQLVRAALAGGRAVRAILPGARLVHTDPVIQVVAHPRRPEERDAAEAHRLAQFEVWDMIAGRRAPELGGTEADLDVLGVNYYVHNQWFFPGGHGSMISPTSPHYRPLHRLLLDVHERYHRPFFIAETGIENEVRGPWLAYVAHEARAAIRRGADLHGVCLYPIVNHPGWDDDRHCHNGLWDYADERGERPIYEPLAREIERQQIAMRAGKALPESQDEIPDLAIVEPIARSIAEATESSREG